MKIKKPHFKKPNVKNIFKVGVKILTNVIIFSLISVGSAGLFLSYVNPLPYLGSYLPLTVGQVTLTVAMLEPLFADINYWQSLGYIAYSISGSLVLLGLMVHVRSLYRLWRGIKAIPRLPMNTYRKLKSIRDWLLKTISYLNEESAKWRRLFNVLKSPYSLLRAFGMSPQLAISLLAIGGTAGGGIVVNELIVERNFSNGDAGVYAAPNSVPSETLESSMKFNPSKDNTLRVVLGSTPVSEINISNVSVGTAFTGSALPSGKTEVLLVEGTDVESGTDTRISIGEMIVEKLWCKTMDFSDITAYKIIVEDNQSDGQSINTTAGVHYNRDIIGGYHMTKKMETNFGLFDRIWIDSPTSAVNGRISRLVLSNLLTKGGSCTFRRLDIGTLIIRKNRVGAGNGFATKEFTVSGVTAQVWEVSNNIEVSTAEPTTQ